jgi:hypothetical protein
MSLDVDVEVDVEDVGRRELRVETRKRISKKMKKSKGGAKRTNSEM